MQKEPKWVHRHGERDGQKIKQDEIFIGKNIRRIRKERGRTFAKEI